MGARVVGIGGGSGSGKSTLAHAIVERSPGACIVELDWYYRDLAHLDPQGGRAGTSITQTRWTGSCCATSLPTSRRRADRASSL
ncbi:MAG: hypothetical protein R2748_28245 [Bryobacterales bacterium]